MDGNAEQIRTLMAQASEATLLKFVADHPEIKRKEAAVPAPLKWAAAIVAALLTAGVVAYFNWLTTTVNGMQTTLARMDERLSAQSATKSGRDDEQDRRIERLEGYHSGNGQ